MPRGIIVLIVLLLVLVGGTYFLSSSVHEQPTQTIEADVATDAAPSK